MPNSKQIKQNSPSPWKLVMSLLSYLVRSCETQVHEYNRINSRSHETSSSLQIGDEKNLGFLDHEERKMLFEKVILFSFGLQYHSQFLFIFIRDS